MENQAGSRFELSSPFVSARWRQFSLTTQFTVVAAIVIGITMAVLGRWVAGRIENSVVTNTATAAALYMDRFVEPYVQELAGGGTISVSSQRAIADFIKTKGIGQDIVGIKIWRPDGMVAYSNFPEAIGKSLPIKGGLKVALQGEVAAELNHLDDDENSLERGLNMPLLEIYSPVRETNSGRIIAVIEFYQSAVSLIRQVAWAQLEGVLMVGALSLLMLGALIGIVRRGSQTIVSQQQALNGRIKDLSHSLSLNEELRQRVADANRRASEGNERFLRRVSAELHDGPVQLIGLALLRLDGVRPPANATNEKYVNQASEAIDIIRGALKDALGEIRGLSSGLALPEIENLSIRDALDLAIMNHERRSGTSVSVSIPHDLPTVALSLKICAYRFVQEGLNNAFRHAKGAGQHVEVMYDGAKLEVEVSDQGPGITGTVQSSCKSGLGLAGMRDRIESLGGTMLISTAAGQGTRLRASFRIIDKR